MMEPLVLEECGALLLRGNEDAEIMCSAPAVTSGASQDVRIASMRPSMHTCVGGTTEFPPAIAEDMMTACCMTDAHACALA